MLGQLLADAAERVFHVGCRQLPAIKGTDAPVDLARPGRGELARGETADFQALLQSVGHVGTILGTDGFIEVRKNIDIAGRPGASHLFIVDGKDTRYVDCSAVPLPYGAQLVSDVLNRTETASETAAAITLNTRPVPVPIAPCAHTGNSSPPAASRFCR